MNVTATQLVRSSWVIQPHLSTLQSMANKLSPDGDALGSSVGG
jgi:hypothetical protein